MSQSPPDPFGTTQPLVYEEHNNNKGGLSGGSHELNETHVLGLSSSTSTPAVSHRPAANGNADRRKGANGGNAMDTNNRLLPTGGGGMSTKTRTVADLRAARESRANEALKMKDEQLRILQVQNNQLLGNLDR